MELKVKTKVSIAVEGTTLDVRIGLDHHGRCWIVGRDLGAVLGQRYPHVPSQYREQTEEGHVLADFGLLSHLVRAQHTHTDRLQGLASAILNGGIAILCDKLMGPRVVEREVIDRVLDQPLDVLIKALPGDHHVYQSLVRMALGAPSIQQDKGPFAPHHRILDVLFTIDKAAKSVPTAKGVGAILNLLGIKVAA